MKNNFKILAVALCAFGIGVGVNNYAMSDVPSKIAVVDVAKVVNASSQVQALRKERQDKAKEVTTFVENARKEIASTTDVKKKQSLEEKYAKELNSKKEAMDKDYVKKLSDIDVKISAIIKSQAVAGNYDVVLTKNVVLYGGTDITDAVSKEVAKAAQAAKTTKPKK